MTVSLDTNLDPTGAFAGLPEVLGLVDYLLPTPPRCAVWLPRWTPRGPGPRGPGHRRSGRRGTRARRRRQGWCRRSPSLVRRDGTLRRDPGRPVRAVDTTGAGDTFDAGFLAALARGLGEAEALTWGTAAGRLATRALGDDRPTHPRQLLDDLAAGP